MPAAPAIDVTKHFAFAVSIARGVRHDYGFAKRGADEEDFEQEARLELVNCATRFDPARVRPHQDPDEQFQKLAKEAIRSRCKRLALKLRNGGTCNTTRTPSEVPTVVHDEPTEFGYEERRRGTRHEGRGRVRFRAATFRLDAVPVVGTDTALAVEGEPDLREWAAAVGQLVMQRRRSLWWIGDLYLYGAARFGPDARDLLGALGYADESLKVAAWVCAKFPAVTRVTGLTFKHHQIAAALPLPEARALLQRCARAGLSTREAKRLRDEARGKPAQPRGGYLKLLATPKAEAEAKALGIDMDAVRELFRRLKGAA